MSLSLWSLVLDMLTTSCTEKKDWRLHGKEETEVWLKICRGGGLARRTIAEEMRRKSSWRSYLKLGWNWLTLLWELRLNENVCWSAVTESVAPKMMVMAPLSARRKSGSGNNNSSLNGGGLFWRECSSGSSNWRKIWKILSVWVRFEVFLSFLFGQKEIDHFMAVSVWRFLKSLVEKSEVWDTGSKLWWCLWRPEVCRIVQYWKKGEGRPNGVQHVLFARAHFFCQRCTLR